MIRYLKLSLVLTSICLSPLSSLFAIQDGQATITVTIEDDYTNTPIEAVLVRLLDSGSEIASGTTDVTGMAELVFIATSTEDPDGFIPESFKLSESYPNPFEQSTNVNLQVDEAQEVKAEIYNIIGQRVASLQVNLTPGTYTLQSSLGHLAHGVYFLRVFGRQVQTIRMTKVGDRIYSGGSILDINSAGFVSRNEPGTAALKLDEHAGNNLSLIASNDSFDIAQQSLQVTSDTSLTVEMSRNNEVIFRVADESSPSQDIEVSLLVEGNQFSEEIITPDTLTLKSGFYTLSADEGNTEAINETIEIASEDQTVTVLTQLKTLADNQLRLEGTITDDDSGEPVNRAYIYLLNEVTSDTLAGPLFADAAGVIEEIVNLDNGPDLDLSVLYRKDGYEDFETVVSVSLPDTLVIDQPLTPAPVPTATFIVSGDQQAGLPVIFDASASTGASGEELTYSWDFGNGKSGGGETIGYIYSTGGSYNVSLTVAGEFGATDKVSQSVSIQAASAAAGSATLSGTIFTSSGEELEGVFVTTADGSVTGVTNPEGDIMLDGLDTGIPLVLTLTRRGYSTQYVRVEIPGETQNATFEASMLPRSEVMIAEDIEAGGDFEGNDGVQVTLPVDGFVTMDGDPVSGQVEMTMTPLDIRDDGNLRAFPGSFSAVAPDGSQGELVSFGLAEYNFEQDGNPVHLAAGKKAVIEIPYYLDMNVDGNPVQAGDIIPLWSLDESTGQWVEEGSGTIVASVGSPTGFTMQAEVTHFSWWNADRFNSPYKAIAECKIIDKNGLPTLDIPDGGACFIRGVTGSGCSGRSAATTQIPSGTTVEIALPGDCNTTLFASSSGGNTVNTTVSGSSGSTISVTIPLEQSGPSSQQTLTVNDIVTNELEQDTDSYLLDPENNELIILELEKLVSGRPVSTLRLFDPNENLVEVIELDNNDSFSAYQKRLLLEVETPGLHRIEIEHTSGNPLFYSLRVQPLEELALNTPADFSVIRGISRYLYYIPDADYIVQSDDGGTLFQSDFNKIGNFLATDDSGGPLNLFSLRQDSIYVIEHTNADGPEVIQKEFTLSGDLRENLELNTENILTVDLIESGEIFKFDPGISEDIIVEIDKSPGDNFSATINLINPNGTVVDTDFLDEGFTLTDYRARVFDEVVTNGLYSIEVVPGNGSTGNYSIRTYAPEKLELGTESEFTVPTGGSYYHIYSPDRDVVVRGTPGGSLLDSNLDEIADLADFSTPGRRPIIGRLLSGGADYIISLSNPTINRSNPAPYSTSTILSEVTRTEINFDGGQLITSNQFTSSTQAHVYTFQAEPNSAVVSAIEQSVTPLIDDFYIGKIGNGTYYDFEVLMNDLSQSSNLLTRSVLQATGTDTYALILLPSPQSQVGSYNLQIDIAETAQAYTISPDLSCPGSTLRSIQAAALAAPENSTITICEGLYDYPVGVEFINPGISLVGTDRESSIIRAGNTTRFIYSDQSDITLENLTIEAFSGSLSSGIIYFDGDNAIVRNITMRPFGDGNSYNRGVEVLGAGSIIEQNEFINGGTGTAIELSGPNGVTIDNNQFLNHDSAIRSRDLSGDVSVTNNSFIYNQGSAVPNAIELEHNRFAGDGVTNRIIESNIINFENESSRIIRTTQSPDQANNDIIRDNIITWMPRSADDVAIDANVGRETSSLIIEQNRITTSSTGGGVGVRVSDR
ncbi:MAG: PKD domain-containing protein, partial [Gracilimonas sp.]|nr:PKD domain-containing protein [Gracilimonas sp.]